jgi:hypothetical protein
MLLQRIFLLSLIVVLSSTSKLAQDHHYWMNMGGTRSALMGGAVIGGVRDNSAGYYNPAGLAFVHKKSHSISSDGYRWENINIDNALGDDIDFESNQIRIIPSLVSGLFEVDFLPWLSFGYTVAAREYSFIKASARHEALSDVINTVENGQYLGNDTFTDLFAGPEDFTGQFLFDANLSEYWGGLSWARKLNENFSYGVTLFMVYRLQTQIQNLNLFAVDRVNQRTASNQIMRSLEYWNIRFVPKVGFSYNNEDFKAGLTITSPSFHIAGQGTVAGIFTSRNIFFNDTGFGAKEPLDLIATDRQQDLTSDYKSPLSVGLGIEYCLTDKINFGFSVEYFYKIDQYDVIKPRDKSFFKGIISDEEGVEYNSSELLKITDKKSDVTNFALGLEYNHSNYVSSYLSFRTDFRNNQNEVNSGTSLGVSDWHIYHASLGAIYKMDNQEIALAITGSYGSDNDYTQIANFTNAKPVGEANSIEGPIGTTTAHYWALGASLGFTYYLD